MSALTKLKYLLVPSYRRAMEQDMRDELEALAAIANSPAELGNLTRVAEETRSLWTWTIFEQFAGDVCYAWRTMRRSPAFTATAVLSLALGIGANTAIFSLMNAILMKTLPVQDPERLVTLASFSRNDRIGDFGYADYLILRDGNHAFSGLIAASNVVPIDVGFDAEAVPAQRKVVSANYFSVLGVQAAVGRVFAGDDDTRQLVVISDRFWRQAFNASPLIAGKEIALDGLPFTVVGVAPPEFLGETVGEVADLFATVSLMPPARRDAPGFTWLNLMGRLNPGFDSRQAALDLKRIVTQMPSRFIERIEAQPGGLGSSRLRDTFSSPLKLLMVVTSMVLLIACANLASLLLARSASRQREISIRLAIGAGRWRVLRQLMTESMLLALTGGALGILFAIWSQRILLTLVAGAGRQISIDLTPDLRVLSFTFLISVATGLLFGLAPALQTVRDNAAEMLKLAGHQLVGRSRRAWLMDCLVAGQVALSFILLIVGGLLIGTLRNLKSQDMGFRSDNVLTVQIRPQRGYEPRWPIVMTELSQRLAGMSGAKAASVSFNGILSDHTSGVNGLKFEGVPPTKENQRGRANWVGPRYFETAGISLIDGREFSAADNEKSRKVAIVNETLSRHYFGNRRAVGRSFEFNGDQFEIVGLAKDAKYGDLREPAARYVYFASLQSGSAVSSLEIRTKTSALAVAGAVREVLREVDPRLRITGITTLEQRVDQKLAKEFLVADIAGFFGAVTVLLAAIGIYGTLAYAIARRTNEIGVRMALGASAGMVMRMVVNDVAVMLTVGLAGGLAGVLVFGRLVNSILFGLKSTDPVVIILAALLLSAAALAAAYIPARRASKVDPLAALRFD